jgi:integrase
MSFVEDDGRSPVGLLDVPDHSFERFVRLVVSGVQISEVRIDVETALPDGRPLDPESVAKVFDRRVARSGLPRIRFHDLRHSHVAHLIAAGEQHLVIARRLGHASSSFTMDRYGHLFEDAGSQAASAVAAMVDGRT